MKILPSVLKALVYFAFSLAFVLLAVWLSSMINPKVPTVVPTPSPVAVIARPLVDCPPNSLSYTASIKDGASIVKLISKRKTMFAANGQLNSQIVVTKVETTDSKVACGYLFVRAGTKSNGPLQKWEDVYINPSDFGGHINPENQFGSGEARDYSEYLFSLNKIQYWKTSKRGQVLNADWAALFNVQDTVKFQIALNTNDKTGFIDELSIAYKSWNPLTGEESKGCSLKVDGVPQDTTVNSLQ